MFFQCEQIHARASRITQVILLYGDLL